MTVELDDLDVDHIDIPADRWVERRAQFLASSGHGLRETTSRAIALHELGFGASGIASVMDVGDSTAKKYLDHAAEAYPGILLRTVADIDGDPEAGFDDLPGGGTRECPVCGKDRLCSPTEAEQLYTTSSWGATSMLEDATVVCSWCHSVKVDGRWERMEAVGSRAYSLAEAGSSSAAEYREQLTSGIETGTDASDDRGADDADELEW